MGAPVNDGTSALLRALRLAFPASLRFVLEEVRSRAWASVTFCGARHEVAFRLEGGGAEAAAAAFTGTLSCAEFTLRGHIVADIALVTEEHGFDRARLRIEALTVEEG
jgi:hypothetical protein